MFPEIDELKKIASSYNFVPVAKRLSLTKDEEEQLLLSLARDKETVYFSGGNHALGNYSYFVIQPTRSITVLDGVLIDSSKQGDKVVKGVNPHNYLERILKEHEQPVISGLPPFTGGLIGYFSYEYTKYYQRHINFQHTNPDNIQDIGLFCCDKLIAYNRDKSEVSLIISIATENLEANYKQAKEKLEELKTRVFARIGKTYEMPQLKMTGDFQMHFNEAEYSNKVQIAKEHITVGDIFQLIMSNPQKVNLTGDLLPLLRQLMIDEPHAYHFYFKQKDFAAVAASPETLITRQGQELASYPLAGTRKLTDDDAKNRKNCAELLGSAKELAEHNMLVDLGRNDLGQISKFGTIHVTKHAFLEKFSTVVHLASVIKSQALPEKSALDVLDAVFPAGTLSGAPKVKAIQIINELEHFKRGIYGGCFGYMSFSGALDMAIGIRLLHRNGRNGILHTGAGIVADSIAKNEYQECLNKSRSVRNALAKVSVRGEKNGITN
ncbi:MAG: chorismate-binding protein [Liquorilactobacillus mali]|uniref:anthranilate synthase component I family protein n=1 Tax=Liquorilactobacillus mali TaxID=1618 RepID=UPI0039E90640